MRKQCGAIEVVYIVIVAVIIAAFAGLWTFYRVKVSALEDDVKAKQAVITTMAKEKAECEANRTGLQTANTGLDGLVKEQNKALAEVKKERDTKTAAAEAAQLEAAKESLKYKGRIAEILAQTAGTDWCGKWSKMVDDYTVMRNAK